jgi:hypothetical protein
MPSNGERVSAHCKGSINHVRKANWVKHNQRRVVDMLSPDVRARDPEDREVNSADLKAKREKMLDKTIADSFPASDPPSSLPDPKEDSFKRKAQRKNRKGQDEGA